MIYSIKNLTFAYQDKVVLKDINMDIEKGEHVAIVGPNGAGKSTLLKIMDFLEPFQAGTITFMGKVITGKMVENPKNVLWVRKHVGFLFQDPNVELFSQTVYEDIIFAPLSLGFPDAEERAEMVMKMLKIEHLKNRAPFLLSDGEKKKVALASVLVMDTDVILLDEPTANLDPKSKREIIEIIKNLEKNGKTVVVASHEIKMLREIAENVYVLNSGKINFKGYIEDLFSKPEILEENNLEI